MEARYAPLMCQTICASVRAGPPSNWRSEAKQPDRRGCTSRAGRAQVFCSRVRTQHVVRDD
ncbi:hypothetical protein PsYK624_115780 [Phanerochaete sordida]|uniref:Uncharacterized protein n=1 Tax=Phanerochaete sordida TaxID=48140 RepID=A0A9P3LI79_9APHY|nr:hypothetical protein PsYK624_115780 [Phanerochaete sordida]